MQSTSFPLLLYLPADFLLPCMIFFSLPMKRLFSGIKHLSVRPSQCFAFSLDNFIIILFHIITNFGHGEKRISKFSAAYLEICCFFFNLKEKNYSLNKYLCTFETKKNEVFQVHGLDYLYIVIKNI